MRQLRDLVIDGTWPLMGLDHATLCHCKQIFFHCKLVSFLLQIVRCCLVVELGHERCSTVIDFILGSSGKLTKLALKRVLQLIHNCVAE